MSAARFRAKSAGARRSGTGGSGSAAKLLLNSVPSAVDGTSTDTNQKPSNTGFNTGVNKMFGKIDSLAAAPSIDFMDANGTGVSCVLKPSGTDVGWCFYPITTYTRSATPYSAKGYNSFGPYADSVETNTTLYYDGSPTAGKIDVYAGDNKLGTIASLPKNLTYVRMRVGGSIGSPNAYHYGAISTPLIIQNYALNGDNTVQLDIDYTNTGSAADIPNIRLFLADGVTPWGPKQQAELISNLTPGKAVIKSPLSALTYGTDQYGTKPIVRLYERVNGVETGFSTTVGINMPAEAFTMGANIRSWMGDTSVFSTTNDLWRTGISGAGGGTLDATTGYYTDASIGVHTRNFNNPLTVGTLVELSWTQSDSASPDATWDWNNTVNSATPQAPLNGRRRLRYTSKTAQVEGATSSYASAKLASGTSGSLPRDVQAWVVGQDKSQEFTSTRVALNSAFKVSRFMDTTNTNANAAYPGTIKGWADRSSAGDRREMDGLATKARFCNATNTDLWYTLPIYWQDDFYLNILPYLDAILNPGLKIYIEWGNEVTNTNLAGGITYRCIQAHYVARTNNPYLGDGGGGLEQVCQEAALENKRVFALMRPTLPNILTRVVFVAVCFKGLTQYNIYKASGFVEYEMVGASAPYIFIGAGATAPVDGNNKFIDQSPAALKPSLIIAMDGAISLLGPFRDAVRADGKRLGSYEMGVDWTRNNIDVANIAIFKRSQEYEDAHYYFFNRLRTEFGGLWCYYNDVGYYPDLLSWSMKETDLATTQRAYDAWLRVKALG